jgi:hypothetical protein
MNLILKCPVGLQKQKSGMLALMDNGGNRLSYFVPSLEIEAKQICAIINTAHEIFGLLGSELVKEPACEKVGELCNPTTEAGHPDSPRKE